MKKKLSHKERLKLIEDTLKIGKIPWKSFTPGVYNYCDRWCERCNKTKKCFLYFSEKKEEELKNRGISKGNDKYFLEAVKGSLQKTKNLIFKIASVEGVDLTITPEQGAKFEKMEKIINPEKEPIVQKTKRLQKEINIFLKTQVADTSEKAKAIEILSWHHYLLYPKIARSVSSKLEAKYEDKAMRRVSLDDSRNSAWVAYRSLKICISTLNILNESKDDARVVRLVQKCENLLDKIDRDLL